MNTLVARVKLDLAFVELQNAFANAYASIGQDPFEDGFFSGEESVQELESSLLAKWRQLGDRHATPGAGAGCRPKGHVASIHRRPQNPQEHQASHVTDWHPRGATAKALVANPSGQWQLMSPT